MGGYAYHGSLPVLQLLWSFSALFGLARMIKGVATENQELFSFGLTFFVIGLLLGLMIRGVLFFCRPKKGS